MASTMSEVGADQMLRAVKKRFEGSGGRMYEHGEVVDAAEMQNADSLERNRYLRKLEYNEPIVEVDGRLWLSQAHAEAHQEKPEPAERASSAAKDEPGGSPLSIEIPERYSIEAIGGGWYNVTLKGKKVNNTPIKSEAAARAYAVEHAKPKE